jgi:hypothetical protein
MPLGIGAGALVLAIGLLSILFYKCYIEVRPEVARPCIHRDTIKCYLLDISENSHFRSNLS